jgi:mono/diheme cytochrome c family protein
MAGALAVLLATGCRQDLFDQAKVKPLAKSDFFADTMGARPRVPGTVAREHLDEDGSMMTGIGPDGAYLAQLPVPLTPQLLAHGRERFDIFCSPCHGRTGDGRGMIVQRGFKQPSSYHTDRLRAQPVGYFYNVMTNGFGQMASYASQVPVNDRWAIAAYVRALQVAHASPASRLAEGDRKGLAESEAPAKPAAPAHGEHGR